LLLVRIFEAVALLFNIEDVRDVLIYFNSSLFKKLCKAIKNNDLTQIREEIALHILLFLQNMSLFYTIIFIGNIFIKKFTFREKNRKNGCEISLNYRVFGLNSQSLFLLDF